MTVAVVIVAVVVVVIIVVAIIIAKNKNNMIITIYKFLCSYLLRRVLCVLNTIMHNLFCL
jgi:hypothetical protein